MISVNLQKLPLFTYILNKWIQCVFFWDELLYTCLENLLLDIIIYH